MVCGNWKLSERNFGFFGQCGMEAPPPLEFKPHSADTSVKLPEEFGDHLNEQDRQLVGEEDAAVENHKSRWASFSGATKSRSAQNT